MGQYANHYRIALRSHLQTLSWYLWYVSVKLLQGILVACTTRPTEPFHKYLAAATALRSYDPIITFIASAYG